MTDSKNVALVFGASGISGWAVTKNLLSYPSTMAFSRIIGLTNRRRSVPDMGLPQDTRLELHSGIDLRGDLDQVKEQMQAKIPNLEEITHMYYCAYSNATAYAENVMEVKNINTVMTYNAVHATDRLCTGLKFLALQTGMNHYGIVFQYKDKFDLKTPLKEETPRIPSPYGDEIFYYAQVDLVKEAAKGKSWGWCEVRPDVIVGFVPNVTGMTYVEPLALYLSLYRYVNGAGASVTFPGTEGNFIHTHTESSQDIIAKAEIYLSVVKPEAANGEAFNIADTATPGPWTIKWPMLAQYFGLKGTGPGDKGWEDLDVWWDEHQEDYTKMCKEYGLQRREIPRPSWVFMKAAFTLIDRNREACLDKIRKLGFTEELPVGKGHYVALDRIAEAKIIPPREAMAEGTDNQ